MSDSRIQADLTIEVRADSFGRFMQALCGPAGPPRLDPDVARWEDDGGPPPPDPIRYTHTIRALEPDPWQIDALDVYRVGEDRYVGRL